MRDTSKLRGSTAAGPRLISMSSEVVATLSIESLDARGARLDRDVPMRLPHQVEDNAASARLHADLEDVLRRIGLKSLRGGRLTTR